MCISECSATQAYNSTSKKCDLAIQSSISESDTSSSKFKINYVPFPFLIIVAICWVFITIVYFTG